MLTTLLLVLQAATSDPLAPHEPLSEAALAEKRGGFVLGNYELEFGVAVAADGAPIRSVVTDRETLLSVLGPQGAARYDQALSERTLTVLRNTEDGRVLSQSVLVDIVVRPVEGAIGEAGPVPLADLPAEVFGSF